LLKDRYGERVRSGPVKDATGQVIGEHDGVAMYTVGQRSGLRVESAGPTAPPQYVSNIDAASNTLTVGGAEQLLSGSCQVEDIRYVAGRAPAAPFPAGVKVRSHAPVAAALVSPLGDRARIDFEEPQRALAPGQAAVFYDRDRLIGGGPISARAA
jgi:tRNA-specific 2-thiouridylase